MDSMLYTNKHGWDNHHYIAMKLAVEQYKENGTVDFNIIAEQTGLDTTGYNTDLIEQYFSSK